MRECQQRAISVTRTATILPVSGLPYSSRHEGVKTAPETAADGVGPVLVGDGPSGNRALERAEPDPSRAELRLCYSSRL